MALRSSFELFAYGVNVIGPGKSRMAWCPSGEAYGPTVEVSEENEAWRNAALETVTSEKAARSGRAGPFVATLATSRASAGRIVTCTRSDYPRADKSSETRKPRYMQEHSPTRTVSSWSSWSRWWWSSAAWWSTSSRS